jgi:2-deoxy-D-gluconate 3-dehydrogenase
MLPELELTDAVALVTGGNRGIGRGIALGLARSGAAIAIAARDQERTDAVVEEIRTLGRQAIGIPCDVTQRHQVQSAVETVRRELGKLTILVNNAGINRLSPPEALTEQDWDAVLDGNLKSAMFVAQAVYPALVANGGGKIINISSAIAGMASELGVAYGVTKAGMVHLTTTLAAAWGKDNIQVNAILPGVIRTTMQARLTDEGFHNRVIRHTPAGRVAEPEELGGVAVFLASRASDFMTGQALVFDGGASIKTSTDFFVRD